MNSRERMISVLEHRLPDRVPLAEMWIDETVVEALLPGATWNELIDHLDMDVVTVPTMIYEEDEVTWVDREKGLFRDKWGVLMCCPHGGVPFPCKPPLVEGPEDLARYTPPDPAKSPVPDKVRSLKARYPNGERAIAVVGESGWAPAVYLRGGIENLLMDFALRPEFAKDLMKVGVAYYTALYAEAVPAGADIVFLGDDYSDKNGPMMSPAMFEDIILPADTEVVAAIKRAGGYCIKHTDGNIRKIMDMLIGTGLDCLGPLEPVPGMALDEMHRHYNGKIALMGNVSVDLLSRGAKDDVIRETKRLLAVVSANGPHVMSSANTVPSSVKPENFLAMVETTKAFGQYPIDADKLFSDLEA